MTESIEQAAASLKETVQGYHKEVRERLDRLEVKANRPRAGGFGDDMATGDMLAHKTAFENWLRNPASGRAAADLESFETKTASIGTGSSGGFAVPALIADQITKRLQDISPVRQLARVVTVSTASTAFLVDRGARGAQWAAELGSRDATDQPVLAKREPTHGVLYARLSMTEELAADAQFSVADWLVQSASEQLAIAEGEAFVSGNGSNRLTGFLHVQPEAAGDFDSPARTAGALQYVPQGNASGLGQISTSSPVFYPHDGLVDLYYGLRAGYRQRSTWLMNSKTAAAVRKLKDNEGRFIWVDGLRAGEPPLLMGRPVVICEDMPDIGTNTCPIALGDWSQAYVLSQSFGLRITVDDNITTPGLTRLYVRERIGGTVLDQDAAKALKIATS